MRTIVSTKGRVALAALALFTLWLALRGQCWTARLRWGIAVEQCPDGRPRQTVRVSAHGLRRGGEGGVHVQAIASYTTGAADAALRAAVRRGSARLWLVDAAGKELALEPKDGFSRHEGVLTATVALPAALPDGDYRLRARVDTPLGQDSHDAELPLYAPARVHVIADRPLYRPGDTLRFRALALRAKDLAPLEQRPGRFLVEDPSGEIVLEERAPAGPWGVAAGTFPLDAGAPEGTWKIRWTSGAASAEAKVRVEPFRLPRLRVSAEASQPFYRAGQRPRLSGRVLYSSGAPVAGARLQLRWRAAGEWPPPTDWLSSVLPRRALADAAGRFAVELPAVPPDLVGQATLSARIAATDAAGDRVESSAQVLLSQDAIAVSAVTELGGGLQQGFNNRVYLRATRADGAPLPGAELLVKRAWDAADKGVLARADEDGVAALQIDPSPPVNVVVPGPPVRPPAATPPVRIAQAHDLARGAELQLADRRALEVALPALAPCAVHVEQHPEGLTLGARVDPAGRVVATTGAGRGLGGCAGAALSGVRFAPGAERLFELRFVFSAAHLPRIEVEMSTVPDSATARGALEQAAHAARRCLPHDAPSWTLPRLAQLGTRAGSKKLTLAFVPDGRAGSAPAPVASCIERELALAELEAEAAAPVLGVARFSVHPAARFAPSRPKATTFLGYELSVAARRGDADVGSTRVRLRPGQVPALRLRVSPVLAEAGRPLEVELIRGPSFRGALPDSLFLSLEQGASLKAKVDARTRRARFELPADASGWAEVRYADARASAWVRPPARLELEVGAEQARYAPGQTARLLVHTTMAGKGARAAVGLFGVDETLGQLAALPGPDELARLRPQAATPTPAFGALDAQALAMGRIRGANAAAATVLQVTALPRAEELDPTASADSTSQFDPAAELADRFTAVLAELQDRVRAWEERAPEAERMQPATMARLWDEAVAACERRGEPARDAYGRPLRLSRLPADLVALADPQALVVNGTRLPEDVESWAAYVAKEQP
jgi:hypothetical protein